MKIKLLVSLLLAIGWLPFEAGAQNLYRFVFRGVAYQTNAAGRFVVRPLNQTTLLRAWARSKGLHSLRGLTLAYHVGGNELGDTIDVISTTNGIAVGTLIGLYFGETFGRVAIKNTGDTQEKRLDYIYTDQISHSIGAATVNKRITRNSNGTTRTSANGQLTWEILPGGILSPGLINGNFVTGKPFVFHSGS